MREELLQLLATENPEIDFTASDELVDDGILDSLTIVSVISTLSMEYGIDIPYEEIMPENFNSIDAMVAMVQRLQA
ncbi:MAG: acyl carrier protein [Lachnospiraceae bacterium]|nr:acyl carrier protein [Lachnospiraceae bacterium]